MFTFCLEKIDKGSWSEMLPKEIGKFSFDGHAVHVFLFGKIC